MDQFATTDAAETARCVNCTRGLPGWDQGRLACEHCQQRAADQLAELPELLAELPARVVPGRGAPMVGTRNGGSGPRDPVNLHVVALMDDAIPLLDSWARDWAEVGGMSLPVPNAERLCGWLRWHLDWACRQHAAVDEAMREIGALHRRVRTAATGERGERPVHLQCPCGGVIRWRVSQDRYRCGCGAVYGREEAAALPAASRVRVAA